MAFAVYKFPGQSTIHFVKGRVERNFQPDSFIIENFSTNELFSIRKERVQIADSFVQLFGEFEKELYLRPENSIKITGEEEHYTIIQKAINEIESGEVKKIVIGGNRKFPFSIHTLAKLLDELSKAFPECFVHLYSSPFTGTWIGATPEQLLVKSTQGFSTMALAGTIKSDEQIEMHEFGQKEIDEQKMVEDFMCSVFQKLNISFTKSSVEILRTGKLNHICTHFDLKMDDSQIIDLLNELHPTPAIGGHPKEKALHFIRSNEPFLRECYTGYIGDSSHHVYYVNLRCAQLVENAIITYAGGGINKGSDARKELTEAENKIANLSRFFKQ